MHDVFPCPATHKEMGSLRWKAKEKSPGGLTVEQLLTRSCTVLTGFAQSLKVFESLGKMAYAFQGLESL